MKNIFVFSLLMTLVFSFGQEKLKVVYKSQMKMDLDADIFSEASKSVKQDEMKQALKEAMEEVKYFELTLVGDDSSFAMKEKINNDLPSEGRIRISFSASGGFTYKNVKTKVYLEALSNFGQDYIITDTLETYDWKITREKSKILNYTVRKATAIVDSVTTLEAWYTPQIPIKSGPGEYWGLPGLILKLTNKYDGKEKREFYYEATEINILDEDTVVEKPTKGERITREKFKEEQKKKLEIFKEMQGGGVDTSD